MSLDLFIDIERTQGIYLLIKTFVVKSVVMRGAIPRDIDLIDNLLCDCVRDRQFITELEIWYLSTTADADIVAKEGQVLFRINWVAHRLEIRNGKSSFRICEDDPLGSISPVYSRVADEIRKNCIRDGVRELFWSVRWIDEVYM